MALVLAAGAERGDPGLPFAAIQRHLSDEQGLDLSRYKESYLRRRLLVRVRALRLAGIEEYARYLRRHPEESARLQRALSIKVTGFFRNRPCFEFLRHHVVPDLVRRARARHPRRLDAWSAGCATGEEAWSLAALFAGSAAGPDAVRVAVLATDLDEAALATARAGVYAEAAVRRDVPAELLRHFEAAPEGRLAPRPDLRRMLVFRRESLLVPFERRDLDLIVCRNVLIYFSLEHQATILGRFADALVPGGYLVLGRVERLFGPARDAFEVTSARDRVYRRVVEVAACA